MTRQKAWSRLLRDCLLASVLVLVLLGVQSAAAAKLTLTGARTGYASAFSPCAGGAVTVTNSTTGPTATQATVTGLDASRCAGKPVELWLRDGSSTLAASPGTVTAASVTLTLPTYTPATVVRALVYVGGWPLSTTWTVTPTSELPLVSCQGIGGNPQSCAVTETYTATWVDKDGVTQVQKTFSVTTTSATPVTWRVTINMSHSSLPPGIRSIKSNNAGLVVHSTSGCSANPRTVTVGGRSDWGTDTVTNSTPRQIDVVFLSAPGGNLLSC